MLIEEDFIDFKCPHCGEVASFPASDAGLVRACPNCTEDFIVPSDSRGTGLKVPLPIATSRLSLRRLAPGDLNDLMEVAQSEEEVVTAWLERDALARLTTPQQTLYLGIEQREGGKLIGYLGSNFTDAECRQAILTVDLNPKFQDGDLATEAIDALLGFCFEHIHLHRVTAMSDSGNVNGRKLFEEVGMRREAEFVKDRWLDGEWRSSIWYAALEEDYVSSEDGNNL